MNIKKGNFDNYNYPAGADADPDCPWNQKKERERIPFEGVEHSDCGSCGRESVYVAPNGNCEDCYWDDPEYYDEEEDETPREDYE